MTLELAEVGEDKRGSLKLLKFGGHEALLSFTLKGKSRSGYFFKVDRVYIVLLGKFSYKEKNMKNGHETERIIETGDHFTVTPGNAHIFTAIEDSYMIEFTPDANGKIEMTPYKPYREICEKDI